MPKLKLAVFISGSGSNLQAIIDAITKGKLKAEIAVVVSNRKGAFGLTRAEEAGIPTRYFPFKPYRDTGKSREAYDADLVELVKPFQPDLVVLAGWMYVLSPDFLNHFPHQVINLHPALPGTFAGVDGIGRTFKAWQRGEVPHGGCMVHYTVPEVDAGPVIAQAIVPIKTDDTLATFENRMHAAEHQLIVKAIGLICDRQ